MSKAIELNLTYRDWNSLYRTVRASFNLLMQGSSTAVLVFDRETKRTLIVMIAPDYACYFDHYEVVRGVARTADTLLKGETGYNQHEALWLQEVAAPSLEAMARVPCMHSNTRARNKKLVASNCRLNPSMVQATMLGAYLDSNTVPYAHGLTTGNTTGVRVWLDKEAVAYLLGDWPFGCFRFYGSGAWRVNSVDTTTSTRRLNFLYRKIEGKIERTWGMDNFAQYVTELRDRLKVKDTEAQRGESWAMGTTTYNLCNNQSRGMVRYVG